jgi:uncharacterized protein (TIGR03435 family)
MARRPPDFFRRTTIRAALLPLAALCCQSFFAQTVASAPPEFEAISIKLSPAWEGKGAPPIMFKEGGPGTGSPTRVVFHHYPLRDLLMQAYGVQPYQISGPSWLVDVIYLQTDSFEISATMAAGTTKEQLAVMLQNAMAERFNLKLHRETRTVPGFALTTGSHSPKLQAAAEFSPSEEAEARGKLGPTGKDGFPAMPPAYSGHLVNVQSDLTTRVKFMRRSMAEFAEWIAATQVKRPVVDRTGLAGRFDFLFEFQPNLSVSGDASNADPAAPSVPGLFSAVESALGLKLVRESCQVETLVIDHADRRPTEN